MTVYSINKQALEQAINQAGTSKPSASPEAAFAAVLQNAGSRFGGATGTEISATKAFKERFDRPVEQQRERPAAERTEKPQARNSDRDGERTQTGRTERRSDAKRGDDHKVERPTDARADEPVQAEDAPKAEQPATEKASAETGSGEQQQAQTGEQAATETEAAAPQTTTAATTETEPQVVQVVVQPAATALAGTTQNTGEQDPFAWLESDHGDAIAKLNNQLDAGDMVDDGALAADDAFLAGAATNAAKSAQTQNAAATGAQAQTAQQAQAKGQASVGDLAQQQAQDMAQSLADTGAALKVEVKVDTATDAAATAETDTGIAADLLLVQDVGRDADLDGQNAGGQNPSNKPQQGMANAAQQVAANGAQDNVQAAQGKAVDAKPFAAMLAAQAETGNSTQNTQSGSGSQNQAVAGVNGPAATQAGQKPAAAHAPQAAHQPRHVDPKQVVDQISVHINKGAKDGDTIKVQLKPVDLGAIEIKLEVQDGKVVAHVSADNKDTLAALQKDSRGLEKALQDAGLKTDSDSLTFSLTGDGKQTQQEAGNQPKPGRRSRLGRAHEAQEIGAAQAAAQSVRTGGRSGVDIRV